MSNYTNKDCPVCKKEFLEDDDIVVCPECGTPHHRECYNLTGHCVNRGLHKANYDYVQDNKDIIETESEKATQENEEKNRTDESFSNPFGIAEVDTVFDKDTDTISGESVGDIASTVRINAAYYVNKFKRLEAENKKLSWNWSAFFFGSFYLLYRKIYNLGMGFYALAIAMLFGSSALLYRFAPKFMELSEQLSATMANGTYPTNEQMQEVMSAPDSKKAVFIVYGLLAVIVLFHIIIALIADNIYKQRVVEIVKGVKEQLGNGASFSVSPMMMGNDIDMTQEQMKRLYLSKRGGTSFILPALAILALGIII